MKYSPKVDVEPISNLASILPGYSPKPEERMPMGKYLLIGGRNINNGHIVTSDKDTYINDIPKNSFRRAIAKPGDIIVSALFDRRKLCIYQKTDPSAVVNSSCAIIRAPSNNDYIVSYLRTSQGKEQFLRDATKATGGTVIPKLSIHNLSMIQIPLIPFEELQRLGDDHIQSSTTDELIILRNMLQSKDAQIALLNKSIEDFKNDRIEKIDDQILINKLIYRIKKGETSKLEFKSSLRWNHITHKNDKDLESAVLKTIVAFCNTDGGELLIGVADDRTILGIEKDNFNDDKFLLHLGNIIHGRIIPSIVQYVDFGIVCISGKRICRVICRQSREGVWLKADKDKREVFYVRSGPSSRELLPHESGRYILDHFRNQ
jgi:hypothetical protein